MGFNLLKKLRQTWSKTWTAKGSKRPKYFRPQLEPLEDRTVPTTRTWTGGSILSNHWSDQFNWQNGVPQIGDSVFFPASAKQRTNVVDIDQGPGGGLAPRIFLESLHIEGGDYDILGPSFIKVSFELISDAGSNKIEVPLEYGASFPAFPALAIEVTAGTLSLTGYITTDFRDPPVQDLVKTGAGTLKISDIIGDVHNITAIIPIVRTFRTFVIQQGLVSMEIGGQLRADLHIENGATVRLGDVNQIFGTEHVSSATNSIVRDPPRVTIDAGGVMDLNGHSNGLGFLTLNGGQITTGASGTLIIDGDVTTTASSDSAVINGTVDLGTTTHTFTIANGTATDDLKISGRIQGTAGLTKQGPGRLALSGSTANTYTGTTRVNNGILALDKPDNVEAVVGRLIIGDGTGGTNADAVVLRSDEQISKNFTVRVNSSGLLSLVTHTETLGGLVLNGGNVTTGFGLLKLLGDVGSESAPTVATISGRLSLQNVNNTSRFFTVLDSVAGTDLLVKAVIQDGAVTKAGDGTMELTATSPYSGDTTINAGQLVVNGTLTSSLVKLNGGTLVGAGTVKGITATSGSVIPGSQVAGNAGIGTLTSTADVNFDHGVTFQPQVIPLPGDPHDLLKVQGAVSLGSASLAIQPQFLTSILGTPVLIDDSNAGFTAESGFIAGAGAGFVNNNVHLKSAGTGSQHATWTFQNLQPGSYRVSTEWGIGGPNLANNVPYTIFDGAIPVTSVSVNQQITANDFSKFGFGWHTLGVVQVTGTSLTVVMSDHASSGFVFADAVLIEPHHVVIIDNDGTESGKGVLGGFLEGATINAVATLVVNGQVLSQTQQYTISYRANDGNDISLGYVTTATAAEDLLITPASIHEGQKVTLTGRLTDPDGGDSLTLTIAWGDGKSETHHPGTQPFAFEHRYAGNPPGRPQGTYLVHLTWFDQHNAGNSRDLALTVQDGAPNFFLPAEVFLQAGGTLAVPGFFTALAVQDHWAVRVDDSNGTSLQPLTLNPAPRSLLQHRYERPDTYRVTPKVTDFGGLEGEWASTIGSTEFQS